MQFHITIRTINRIHRLRLILYLYLQTWLLFKLHNFSFVFDAPKWKTGSHLLRLSLWAFVIRLLNWQIWPNINSRTLLTFLRSRGFLWELILKLQKWFSFVTFRIFLQKLSKPIHFINLLKMIWLLCFGYLWRGAIANCL